MPLRTVFRRFSKITPCHSLAQPSPLHLVHLHGLGAIPEAFQLFPDFLDESEQKLLLKIALRKLDGLQSLRTRRRQRQAQAVRHPSETIMDLFLPEELYDFEMGHYDGVIHDYREARVSAWPALDPAEQISFWPILKRIQSLLTSPEIQTHVLHLSSAGKILPHVDNISASGTCILGVSLGSTRILRMESLDAQESRFDVLLPSGSVYVQRDEVRYRYRHSILGAAFFKDRWVESGPRVSVMMRDDARKLTEDIKNSPQS